MKKILCVLLVLACMLCVVSCGDKALDAFNVAVAETSPSKVEIFVEQTTDYGPFILDVDVVYAEDGSAKITGTRDVLNPIDSGAIDEVVATVPVNVTCDANGNYSDGGAFSGSTTVATGVKFNFTKDNMTYTVSPDGNVLNATIAADKTEATLGVKIDAEVSLTLTMREGKIVSFTMTYTVADTPVYVNCVYS